MSAFVKTILFFVLVSIFCANFRSQYGMVLGISKKLLKSSFFVKNWNLRKPILALIVKFMGIWIFIGKPLLLTTSWIF